MKHLSPLARWPRVAFWRTHQRFFCGLLGLILLPLSSHGARTVVSYDKAGRLASITHENGGSASYVYDKLGNITAIRTQTSAQPTVLVQGGIIGVVARVLTDYAIQVDRPADVTGFVIKGLPSGLKANAGNGVNRDGKPPGTIYGTPTKAGHFLVQVSARSPSGIGPVAVLPIDISNPFLPSIDAVALKGNYTVVLSPAGSSPDLGGLLTLTLAEAGTYSARLTWAGTVYTLRGQFDPVTGVANAITIPRPSPLSSLQVTLSLNLIGADRGQLLVGVTDGALNVSGTGSLHAWNSPQMLAAYLPAKGQVYNLALGGDPAQAGNPLYPQGAGHAAVRVTAKGQARLAGRLQDGTSLTLSQALLPDGTLPIYSSLYRKLGVLNGQMQVDVGGDFAALDNTLTGQASWHRPVIAGNLYPLGFQFQLSLAGGIYQAPASGERVLGLGKAAGHADIQLELQQGGLGAPILAALTISPANKVTAITPNPDSITLKFTAATGLVTGSFKQGLRKATFSGLILPASAPDPSEAFGYFLLPGATTSDPTLSGALYIGPP
jgi:YD repeat-containing protein